MSHEDGCLLVGARIREEVLELIMKEQVARETEDTSQLLRRSDTGEDGHGAALGEAADDNAITGYSSRYLTFY